MRQVLVKKERGFNQEPQDLREWRILFSKTNLSSLCGFQRNREGRFLFVLFLYFFTTQFSSVFLCVCALGLSPLIFFLCSVHSYFKFLLLLNVRAPHWCHLGQWGSLPGATADCQGNKFTQLV